MTAQEKKLLKLINENLQTFLQGTIPVAFISDRSDLNHNISTEIKELYNNLKTAVFKIDEGWEFVNALSRGDLDIDPPAHNFIISRYKQLQANLRHLTWQTQQIASGDYSQKVTFLGEFSTSFNKLTASLKEKKKLEDELLASEHNLRELNALKDKMFSVIAHDLRGPIGNNQMLIELLLEENDYSETERIKEFLSMLQKSSVSVFNLLENLLNWARSQTNEMRFDFGFNKLNDIVNENINLLAVKARFKNIKIHSEVKKLILVYCDLNSMHLIFRNLLSNALKFTPCDGEVKVSADRIDGQVKVTIQDNGVGISEENLVKIFNPLSNFTTKGTENEHGSGLGLLLCKELIEKNKGKLTINSTVGKGSIFSFTIPAKG